MANKQPDGLSPGIYFELSNEDYHKDSALSHSGMVNLLKSPLDFWSKSHMNPERKEFKPSDAMIFGTRCHELLLEPKRFYQTYNGTGKGWDINKKITINQSEFKKILASIEEIKAVPEDYAYFQDGFPEVSIIWEDPATGVRLRIRIDWLRTFGGVDYKRDRDIDDNALGWSIGRYGYDIQEVLYREGIAHAKEQLRQGKFKIFGTHDLVWLKRFQDEPRTYFRFFFQRSEAPYIYRIVWFDNDICSNARSHVEDAKRIYKEHIESHGTKRWPAKTTHSGEFSIYMLPKSAIDRGAR
jgi:hypothetical protein